MYMRFVYVSKDAVQKAGGRAVRVSVFACIYLSGANLSTVDNIGSHAGEQLLRSIVFFLHSTYHEGQFG